MPDTRRFLLARSQHGYTNDPTRATRTEPEAITEHTYRTLELKAATQRADQRRQESAQHGAAITRELTWLQSQRF